MDSAGIPEKVSRYILKSVTFFNKQNKQPKLSEIIDYVKMCNKNRVPISNLKHAVLITLKNLEKTGLINKDRNGYTVNDFLLEEKDDFKNEDDNYYNNNNSNNSKRNDNIKRNASNNKRISNKKVEKKIITNNAKSNTTDTTISKIDTVRNIITSFLSGNKQTEEKNELPQKTRRKNESNTKQQNVKNTKKRKRSVSLEREFAFKKLRKSSKDKPMDRKMTRMSYRSTPRSNSRHYRSRNFDESNTSLQSTTSYDSEHSSDDDVGNNLVPIDSAELRKRENNQENQDEQHKEDDVEMNENENKNDEQNEEENNTAESK